MGLIGFSRQSTTGQNHIAQRKLLRDAGVERIFEDTISGSLAHRPGGRPEGGSASLGG